MMDEIQNSHDSRLQVAQQRFELSKSASEAECHYTITASTNELLVGWRMAGGLVILLSGAVCHVRMSLRLPSPSPSPSPHPFVPSLPTTAPSSRPNEEPFDGRC